MSEPGGGNSRVAYSPQSDNLTALATNSMGAGQPRIAYLFSRYPVVSQTFCDSEMLALERMGVSLEIASINPPSTSFRHERLRELRAEIHYPPPSPVLKARMALQERVQGKKWAALAALREEHDGRYGAEFKAGIRARNGLYFAMLFQRLGVDHVHVHFANRATHTALFIKRFAGIPFSFTAHAQDFMVDLGSDDLLREMCAEAAFVVAVSDFSKKLLQETCPDSAGKILRIYNGLDPESFPRRGAAPETAGPIRILSVGRLIEFKGFHHLVGACARLKRTGIEAECTIVGEGPWEQRLKSLAEGLGVTGEVRFAGVLSQEEIKRELERSDMFVLASVVDAQGASDILPTVITEAMASELPVISTTVAGVPEMVDDKKTGLLVPPGDEEALADAIAALAKDPEARRRYGRAGLEKAGEVFSLEKTAAQLKEKFITVLSEDGDRPRHREDQPRPKLAWFTGVWPMENDDQLSLEMRLLTGESQPEEWGLFVGSLPEKFRWKDNPDVTAVLPEVEVLPDAVVLEAQWKQEVAAEPGIESRIEELRSELGELVSAETFQDAARTAVYLVEIFRKRGIRALHAARTSGALPAWLVHHLGGIPFSLSVERNCLLDPEVLNRICSDAAHANVACPRMSSALRERFPNELKLRPPRRKRRIRIGPLKMKIPSLGEGESAAELAPAQASWYAKVAREFENAAKIS